MGSAPLWLKAAAVLLAAVYVAFAAFCFWLISKPRETGERVKRKIIHFFYGRTWYGKPPEDEPDPERRLEMMRMLKLAMTSSAVSAVSIAFILIVYGWSMIGGANELNGQFFGFIIAPIFILFALVNFLILYLDARSSDDAGPGPR